MRTLPEIVNAYHERRKTLATSYAAATQIAAVYDGKIDIALPELEMTERPQVANLIQSGIDQHAMRIASVLPTCTFPVTRAGKEAQDRAKLRHDAAYGWWAKNRMPLIMRRRARYLIAQATSPVVIRPSLDDGIPRWHVREPTSAFPAPGLNPDEILPSDCIFAIRRSWKWLLDSGFNLTGLATGPRDRLTPDTLFDCLEYIDADQVSLVVLGRDTSQPAYAALVSEGGGNLLLASIPNRTGRPLAVVPGRITLNGLSGQFDQMIGMYTASAKLWGLHLHGVARAIFGENWAVIPEGSSTTNPIVTPADPIEGTVGVTTAPITQLRPDPGFQTIPALNMLERNQRLTGAVPAEFGGESASNVRTGRRGQQTLSAVVDFPVQEHQEILAASLEEENRVAIAIAKAYSGSRLVSFTLPNARTQTSYRANDIFGETDDHTVSYAYPGTDTNGLVIEAGQRIGMGTLSKEGFMVIDPLVKDVELEKDRMTAEMLQQAGLQSILAQSQDPAGPYQPVDLARIAELVLTDKYEWWEAIKILQTEKQAEQAAAAQGALPPEQMQPGLGQAGAPGTPQAAIGPPQPSQSNLLQLLGALRLPQRQSAAEQASPY